MPFARVTGMGNHVVERDAEQTRRHNARHCERSVAIQCLLR